MKNPGQVRALTCGTKSPSRLEALRFIDSSKSPSTKMDGSLVNFRRRLSNQHGRPWRMLIWTFIARNVTGRQANGAGARSTLKTVDRRKMTAEEEKIALVAVVAVKEEWKAPGEVSKKRRLAACFCSLWDQNVLFLHTLRAFFGAFQGEGSFVYAMMGGEK